jgi:hypothetical protein
MMMMMMMMEELEDGSKEKGSWKEIQANLT